MYPTTSDSTTNSTTANGRMTSVTVDRASVAPAASSSTDNVTHQTKMVSRYTAPSIPWNLDRRALLVVFLVIGFLTGSFFFNWPPAQLVYVRSGAYSWLCSPEQPAFNLNLLSDTEIFEMVCDEQVQAIDSLMPIGVASMFVFAFIGGMSVDYLGPKISALMGLTFQISGWILLAFCGQNFPLYPVANMLMGCGNDPVYIALLDISNLFPGYRGMIIAILSASRSLSFALPSIFNLLLTSYPETLTLTTVFSGYIGVLAFCLLIVLFVFPYRCFSHSTEMEQTDDPIASAQSNFSFIRRNNKNKSFDSNASFPTTHHCGPTDFSFFSSTSAGSTYSVSRDFRPSRVIPVRPIEPSCSLAPGSSVSLSVPASFISTSSISTPSISTPAPTTAGIPSSSDSIWSDVNSGLYLPLLPIAATTILSGTFFANSSREQLGSALTMFVILNPLSFISGVVMGYLADHCGPLFVMCIMNFLGLLQFVLLLFEDVFILIPYMTAFVSCLVVSFFLTQLYCFIALTFPGRHFGSLSGFVVMSSGLLSLVVTPMCDFSSFAGNYVPMNGLCLSLTATNIVFLYIMYKKQGSLLIRPPQMKNANPDPEGSVRI